jgi:hypothetical protein
VTIDEHQRYQLHQALDTTLGPENAATLMAHLPPVGWADVATKHDLNVLRNDLHAVEERLGLRITAEIASVRTEFADLRGELHTEIADLRGELHTEIAGVRTELHTEIAGVRTELHEGIAGVRTEIAGVRTELHKGLRNMTITCVGATTALVSLITTFANRL